MPDEIQKIYIISGESSGDLHGSFLVSALLHKSPDLQIRAWGGDLMQSAGAEIVKHYRDLAFMGFTEVAANLKTIVANFNFCKQDIEAYNPDVVVLIDYPGFNLRMAKWLHGKSIKVVYYIAPQVWAWKESRVVQIRDYVDQLVTILPFETSFFKKHQINAIYVGHPLMEAIEAHRNKIEQGTIESKKDFKYHIVLLPGSRSQEIKKILPVMLSVVPHFKECQFLIAGASAQSQEIYESILDQQKWNASDRSRVQLVFNQTYDLLIQADAALVTSGTATLETALFGVPQTVCYKSGWVSYIIAKWLVKVKYISLVNLILDRMFIRELIQGSLNTKQLRQSLSDLLDPKRKAYFKEGYDALQELLSEDKKASELTADVILEIINTPKS